MGDGSFDVCGFISFGRSFLVDISFVGDSAFDGGSGLVGESGLPASNQELKIERLIA